MQDLNDLLKLFSGNQEINNFTTIVYGSDLCEMLGLFHDIAEALVFFSDLKMAELEKYKIAYNNRVRRDKRKEQAQKQEEKKRLESEGR